MQRIRRISVFLMIGLLIIGIAVFSGRLGLNLGWGKGRIAVLLLGLFVLIVPWLSAKKTETHQFFSHSDLFAFPALLAVIAMYIWFIRVSRDLTSNYYDLLGASFRQGELSLPLRPDPALLALPNPYDPAARQGIKVPLDLALYDGKFYLYWGPAPALLLAILKPLFPGQVSDGDLLFAFVCGIFLSQFLLVITIWERFFPNIPKWIVILSIFVTGLINPTLWLLSRPKIYETAIAGGQFFFIAGFLFAFTALDTSSPSGWRLVMAGIFWSLAVGTRSMLLFPIAFLTLMVIYWFHRMYPRSLLKLATGLIPLGVPLSLGAVAFGWYNWVRFGSISETGFTYAMAGPDLRAHLGELFSPAYLFQNLYNYLFHPFAVKPLFPFFISIRGVTEGILSWPALPEFYAAQAVTGILWAAPFLLFAVIPITVLFQNLFKNRAAGPASEDSNTVSFRWITISLIGAFLMSFVFLLSFFWIAMRYAEDFIPMLTLLSIIGFWYGYRLFSQDSKKSKIYIAFGTTLAGISIVVGIFLALSNYYTSAFL